MIGIESSFGYLVIRENNNDYYEKLKMKGGNIMKVLKRIVEVILDIITFILFTFVSVAFVTAIGVSAVVGAIIIVPLRTIWTYMISDEKVLSKIFVDEFFSAVQWVTYFLGSLGD